MNTEIKTLCEMIRNRTKENRQAIRCFACLNGVLSPMFSILRQELDSIIRVIYLLTIKDLAERQRLIESTLKGEKWKIKTSKGKWREVTDHEMVDLAQQLQGWTKSVYKFGCAFIHLSDFHLHYVENPFDKLSESERKDIISHMRHYYGRPSSDNPSIEELTFFIPSVFEKIASNLECYIKQLEQNEMID